MLKHSLLQPQMFFNSWFPQLAFPCLRRFIVLIIFHHVPHGRFAIEPLFIYFFITPKAQNTRTAQCKSPAVRHIGSSMLFGSAYKSWWSIYFPPLFTFFQANVICTEQVSCRVVQWLKFTCIKTNLCWDCMFTVIFGRIPPPAVPCLSISHKRHGDATNVCPGRCCSLIWRRSCRVLCLPLKECSSHIFPTAPPHWDMQVLCTFSEHLWTNEAGIWFSYEFSVVGCRQKPNPLLSVMLMISFFFLQSSLKNTFTLKKEPTHISHCSSRKQKCWLLCNSRLASRSKGLHAPTATFASLTRSGPLRKNEPLHLPQSAKARLYDSVHRTTHASLTSAWNWVSLPSEINYTTSQKRTWVTATPPHSEQHAQTKMSPNHVYIRLVVVNACLLLLVIFNFVHVLVSISPLFSPIIMQDHSSNNNHRHFQ